MTHLNLILDNELVKAQLDTLRPKLTLEHFQQECSNIVEKPGSAVQKLASKLKVEVSNDVGRPDVGVTQQQVSSLYTKIMTTAAEAIPAEENALELAKKNEQARIKRLNEVTQQQLLERAVEQKVLEMSGKVKAAATPKSKAKGFDIGKDKFIDYKAAFVNLATGSDLPTVVLPELDPKSFEPNSSSSQS
eukprot:3958157-Karenia_brevis.AAC.1